MNILIGIIGGVAILYICGRFESQIREIIRDGFNILRWPFDWIVEAINNGLGWLNEQIRRFTEDDLTAQHFIGAILYTGATIVFLGAGFGLALLTLQAMGLSPFGKVNIPFSADILAAASLLAMGMFWGLILFDLLGITHLAPWERLKSKEKRVLKWVSVVCLSLTIILGMVMGVWRGYQLIISATTPAYAASVDEHEGGIISLKDNFEDNPSSLESSVKINESVPSQSPSQSSSPFFENMPVFVSALLTGLEGISAAFAGIGAVILLGCLFTIFFTLLKIPLCLLRLILQLPITIIEAGFRLITSILNLIADIGRSIFRRWIPANEVSPTPEVFPTPPDQDNTILSQPPNSPNNTEEALTKRVQELEERLQDYEQEDLKRQYHSQIDPLGLEEPRDE